MHTPHEEMNEMQPKLKRQFREIHRLQHAYFHKKRMEVANRTIGYQEERLLAMLNMEPESDQEKLSYLLDISSLVLDEWINKLEIEGFLLRKKEEGKTKILLTESGHERAEKIKMGETEEHLLDVFNEEEKEQFEEYMDRLIHVLEEHVSKEDFKNLRQMHTNCGRGEFPFHSKRGHGFRGYGRPEQ